MLRQFVLLISFVLYLTASAQSAKEVIDRIGLEQQDKVETDPLNYYLYIDSIYSHYQKKPINDSLLTYTLLWKSKAYYYTFTNIDSALSLAQKANTIAKKNNYTDGLYESYTQMAKYLTASRDYPSSKNFYDNALRYSTDALDSARTYKNLGELFLRKNKDSVMYFLDKSRLLLEKADTNNSQFNFTLSELYFKYSSFYTSKPHLDYEKALQYSKLGVQQKGYTNKKNSRRYISSLITQSFIHRKLGNIDSARSLLVLAKTLTPTLIGSYRYDQLANILKQQAYLERGQRNFELAAELFREQAIYADSVSQFKLDSRVLAISQSYEQQLKDKEIITLKSEDSRKSKILYGSVFASLLFIALGLYAFAQYRRTKKQNALLAQNRDEIAAISKNLELSLKEIHHRIKNNLQVISSLLSLQKNSLSSPEAKEALAESQNRIRAMALIHEQLYSFSEFDQVSLRDYVVKITDHIATTFKTRERITFQIEMDDAKLPLDESVSIGMIINELATNALKYGFPNEASGTVHIAGQKTNGIYTLQMHDTGIGLPADFQLQKQRGVGYQIMQALSIKLKGKLEVLDNSKAHIQITLPIS